MEQVASMEPNPANDMEETRSAKRFPSSLESGKEEAKAGMLSNTNDSESTKSRRLDLPLGLQHFIAGTLGGILGVIGGHPLDTIKVRLQSQTIQASQIPKYTGPYQCFLRILREEKAVGLFKGMSSPLVGVALVNAFLFGVYGSVLSFLEQSRKRSSFVESKENGVPFLSDIFIAGSASGLVNSILSCPLELAKIQIQNQQQNLNSGSSLGSGSHPLLTRVNISNESRLATFSSTFSSSSSSSSSQAGYRNPWEALRAAYTSRGLRRGVYLGLGATILRETPSYGAYFVSYELLCRWLSPSHSASDVSDLNLMIAGGLSGSFAWMTTYPLDVLKTRIQSQSLTSHSSLSLWHHFKTLLAKEGWRVYFRGLDATLLRAFPTNALIFLGYAYTMRLLGGDDDDGQSVD